MVGQTLKRRSYEYRYYRCRHAYDKNTGFTCSARYIRCDLLEGAVWREVKRVLTRPEIVLKELRRRASMEVDESEIHRLETSLSDLVEREKRLVHLFTLGQFEDEILRKESASIAAEKSVVEERLASLRSAALPFLETLDDERLRGVCAAVDSWLDEAGESDRLLALEAMQIEVRATTKEVRVSGVLPVEVPSSFSDEELRHSSHDAIPYVQPSISFGASLPLTNR